MTRKTLKEVVVVIEKDTMMKIPTTVYEHEVLVLTEIHGEDKVVVKEEYEVYAPEDFVVADEFERMKAKYGRRLQSGQPHPVERAWGKTAAGLADHLGLPRGKAAKHIQNESEQIVRDPRRVDSGEDGLVSTNSASAKVEAETPKAGTQEPTAPKVKPAATAKPAKAKAAKAAKAK